MDELQVTITAVLAANRLNSNVTAGLIHRHNRKCWAIALKRTGKTIYYTNGEALVSDASHPAILPKGCDYSWKCVEPGECLLIEFDAPQTLASVLSFQLTDSSIYENAFFDIQKNLHIGTATAHLTCMHRVYGLLLQLLHPAQREYASKQKQLMIQPALDYITEQYFDPNISNEVLATLCGISTVYFRKTFESVYGVAPIRYLHGIRMRRAKDILSSDYDSIAQVAESVGYSSVYHFSKMFRTYTGMSPSQYAKASRL